MDTKDATCEERISEHRDGRLALIADLLAVSGNPDAAGSGPSPNAVDRLYADGEIDSPLTNEPDELQEQAQERLYALPLGVSTQTVFRIELSTGGPADWLEVVCNGYEEATLRGETLNAGSFRALSYEIDSIRYHFADWFDHAEDALTGDDFEIASQFARSIVPELAE